VLCSAAEAAEHLFLELVADRQSEQFAAHEAWGFSWIKLTPSLAERCNIQIFQSRKLLIERTHGGRPYAGTR
jgi:hypothetical protein